ncbi:MAG: 3'-5' exonuclease [Chitinophagaceae bacterium]
MKLTTEQEAILQTNHHLVINAVAGSGKTTTLIEYAKSRPAKSSILYLAFNKTVKTEAAEKFAAAGLKNVRVETAHSLAFDQIIKFSNYQLVPGYKSYELCDMLQIVTGDRHTDFIIAGHVNKFISFFCNSRASKVQEIDYAATLNDAKAQTFVKNFYSLIETLTRTALAKMDKGEIAITHDFYLKKFQLSNPVLPYDYILFDEGQDASGAMLDVFLKQKAIKIIVGDAQQQIYGWRYAINSLQQVDFPVYNLTHSFRFNDEIALVANKILAWKKEINLPASVPVIGVANHAPIVITKATLGRSNLSLLLNAITQWQHGGIKKIYFEGNISSYTFADEGASLYDVLNLHNSKKDKIKDRLIAEMKDMKDLEDYIEKTEDASLRMIVEVVKEFGNKLPTLISELKNNHVSNKLEADMIFSTVHRCKGMEYDEVTLLNDFISLGKLRKQIAQLGGEKLKEGDLNRLSEEINILYVAATRAKSILKIPAEINPLSSVQTAEPLQAPVAKKPYYTSRNNNFEDIDMLRSLEKPYISARSKTSNHGKKWSADEEDFLQQMFMEGKTIRDMAKALARGENGVKYKLQEMGLEDAF